MYQNAKGLNAFLATAIGVVTFLSLALLLCTERGFQYGMGLLVLLCFVGILCNFKKSVLALVENYLIVLGFCLFPLAVFFGALANNNLAWSLFDFPSRYVLLAVAFLYLKQVDINKKYLYYGAVCGVAFTIPELVSLSGEVRLTLFENSNTLGILLVLLIAILLTGIELPTANRYEKLVFFFAVMIGIYACFLTASRGAFVALSAVLLLFFLRKNVWMILFLGVFMIIAINHTPTIKNKLSVVVDQTYDYLENGNHKTNIGRRLSTYKLVTFEGFKKPVFGHGYRIYSEKMLRPYEHLTDIESPVTNTHAHNDYVHVFYELGFVGVLSILVPLLGLLFFVFRFVSDQEVFGLLVLTVLAISVFGLTDVTLSYSKNPTLFVLFLLAYGLSIARNSS